MNKREFSGHIRHAYRTLIRYFLSYFLPLSFLLISFFLVVRVQLSNSYLDMLNQQANKQLENIRNQFSDDLMTIDRINSSLAGNVNLALSRHTDSTWNQYLAFKEIGSYALASELIQCIVYYDKIHDRIYSSEKYVDYADGVFHIYRDGQPVAFDTSRYKDSITNQLVLVGSGDSSYLIYYPCPDASRKYSLFYIINEIKISNILNSIISDEIVSTALISPDGRIAVGTDVPLLAPYLSAPDESKKTDSQATIQTCSGIYNGFTMVALISDKALMNQINTVFSRTYLILFLLGVTGMFILFFAMSTTYRPLRKLTQKIVKDSVPGQSYLAQLDSAFSASALENQNLQSKVKKYSISMQKAILGSIISDSQSDQKEIFERIEPFFSMEPDNLIFILRMGITPPDRPRPIQRPLCP